MGFSGLAKGQGDPARQSCNKGQGDSVCQTTGKSVWRSASQVKEGNHGNEEENEFREASDLGVQRLWQTQLHDLVPLPELREIKASEVKESESNASILHEMQNQERDGESSPHNHEEQQTGNTRIVFQLRNEDVPDRQGIRRRWRTTTSSGGVTSAGIIIRKAQKWGSVMQSI